MGGARDGRTARSRRSRSCLDLSRLQRDIIGIARYRVLLRAGLVEQPRVAFARNTVEGGRDLMKIDNTTVRITDQPGIVSASRAVARQAGGTERPDLTDTIRETIVDGFA